MNTSGKSSTEYYKELYRIQDKVLSERGHLVMDQYIENWLKRFC